jgi:hypothetical protein
MGRDCGNAEHTPTESPEFNPDNEQPQVLCYDWLADHMTKDAGLWSAMTVLSKRMYIIMNKCATHQVIVHHNAVMHS